MALERYWAKRDFTKTAEPRGRVARDKAHRFVVQQHAARRMHFDFRLAWAGVLKSWAVPKGPSLDPEVVRLAVEVEDHPVDYRTFEGVIPPGSYGAGKVIVWDEGFWEPLPDADKQLAAGHLRFTLRGQKLAGAFSLVRTRGKGKQTQWLLRKRQDAFCLPGDDVTRRLPHSLYSGRTVHEVDGPPPAAPPKSGPRGRTRGSTHPPTGRPGAHDPLDAALLGTKALLGPWTAEASFAPQLAVLADALPTGRGWLYEVKLDGYRLLATRTGGTVVLCTRNGYDWTARLSSVADALAALPGDNFVVDGELVVLDAAGRSDFAALQESLHRGGDGALQYCVFDLLAYGRHDLRGAPQTQRKAWLETFLAPAPKQGTVRYWPHVEGVRAGAQALAAAHAHGLEGIVAKRGDAAYRAQRGPDWCKVKCVLRQSFVVGGFVGTQAKLPSVRALAVGGYTADGKLAYAGRVGSGLTQKLARSLGAQLAPTIRRRPPFVDAPPDADVSYVKPQLVVEVRFAERTREGRLRHASLVGVREDRPAQQVRLLAPEGARETAADDVTPGATRGRSARTPQGKKAAGPAKPIKLTKPAKPAKPTKSATPASNAADEPALTHPERRVAPGSSVTKGELAAYMRAVAPLALVHLGHRPLSVLRCPEPDLRRNFFQKHLPALPGLYQVPIGGADYSALADGAGLVQLVQLGVLEIHPWGAHADAPLQADTLTFDLDPGEGVEAAQVVAAAHTVREVVASLGFVSAVKATGGKGLHVVVGHVTGCSWPCAKAFALMVADYVVAREPGAFVATVRKSARRGKIFIDYLRNGQGATAVGVYSPRARVGLPVARPLRWAELTPSVLTETWDVARMARAVAKSTVCPWADAWPKAQPMPPLLAREAERYAASRA